MLKTISKTIREVLNEKNINTNKLKVNSYIIHKIFQMSIIAYDKNIYLFKFNDKSF